MGASLAEQAEALLEIGRPTKLPCNVVPKTLHLQVDGH